MAKLLSHVKAEHGGNGPKFIRYSISHRKEPGISNDGLPIFHDHQSGCDDAYSTPKPPHISVQTLPAIPAETGHPLHPKPYHPFQSKVGHPFQSKPAVQAG